ncbi:MAG: pyridoxamine 5'-phosphate oxidase family protein [Bacteroidia bacterium]|nr:pyridoxamine 5'-phosphate oxidase family protein [Bacteroidia bacterium]
MRRQDKEITDNRIIQEILEKSAICRLGLVDKDEAYIVPTNYAYENGLIYIHSAPAGRKIDLIKRNNRITFEIEYSCEIIRSEIPCNWTTVYRSVMGKGTIFLENDPESKKRGLDLIMLKYGAAMELNYDESLLSRMIILKLRIDSITGKQSGNWQ